MEATFGVGLSEQLELKKSTTEYFPYVLFFYGGTDSAFVKNIEKFRKSFANGVWQDSVARVKSADYLCCQRGMIRCVVLIVDKLFRFRHRYRNSTRTVLFVWI